MLRKFGDSFFWIQHVQIRLNDISEHFYQKMHSHVAFCVIYTRLYHITNNEYHFKLGANFVKGFIFCSLFCFMTVCIELSNVQISV